jgi:hypothetical protein
MRLRVVKDFSILNFSRSRKNFLRRAEKLRLEVIYLFEDQLTQKDWIDLKRLKKDVETLEKYIKRSQQLGLKVDEKVLRDYNKIATGYKVATKYSDDIVRFLQAIYEHMKNGDTVKAEQKLLELYAFCKGKNLDIEFMTDYLEYFFTQKKKDNGEG